MSALVSTAKLINGTADLLVSHVNPVVFDPVQAQWVGCQTAEEATDAVAVLAVGIATGILKILQDPKGLAPQSAVAHKAVTTGGFVITISISPQHLAPITMLVLLPSAVSDTDARRQAYIALLQLVKDTVEYHWVGFTRRIDEDNATTWPAWAKSIRSNWTW
jgi:hypothetical protein